MNVIHRQLLTGFMLAIYGGIALLGYGLHSLSPHGVHHGLGVVTCATHSAESSCDCAFHRRLAKSASERATGGELVVTQGGCATCCHECGICTLLVQLGSSRSQLAPVIAWQPVVSRALSAAHDLCSPATSLGPQAPRGPPSLLA